MTQPSPTPVLAGAPAPLPATVAPLAAPVRSRRRPIILAAVAALALAATVYGLHARHFEATDDAQIDGDISNVSPRITGHVARVYVSANQPVKAGELLAELDPAELQNAVAQARAEVAVAKAQLDAEDPSVSMMATTTRTAVATARSDLAAAYAALAAALKEVERTTAQLAQAQAESRTAELEQQRGERLIRDAAITQSEYDRRVNVASGSASAVEALRQSLAASKERVKQQRAQIQALHSHVSEVASNAPRQLATREASVVARRAALELAKTRLAQAEKNLSYARIVAPISGIILRKNVAVGDHVSPGQLVFAIAQTESLWVVANYRETQLRRMQAGQGVEVHVDAVDLELHGTVESLGGATGSRLSVLPPENASGNYVKVVQRIPVRIALDGRQAGLERLRIGMSVEPTVRVR